MAKQEWWLPAEMYCSRIYTCAFKTPVTVWKIDFKGSIWVLRSIFWCKVQHSCDQQGVLLNLCNKTYFCCPTLRTTPGMKLLSDTASKWKRRRKRMKENNKKLLRCGLNMQNKRTSHEFQILGTEVRRNENLQTNNEQNVSLYWEPNGRFRVIAFWPCRRQKSRCFNNKAHFWNKWT
jgi:hypothetical protein